MDEVNFERNLSGFILSVLHAACSESEAEALHKTTLETTKEIKETATEAERADFFRDIRSKELDRLTKTLNKQSDEAKNHDDLIQPKVINKEIVQIQGEETEAFETEEATSKEERLAFFQSIKERERKWKEERESKRMRKRQEKIKQMFAEFHTPAVSPMLISYSSKEQEPDLNSTSSPVNSCSQEPLKSLSAESRDTDEPTKSQIKISDAKHTESTTDHSPKSTSRLQRFRTWFKRLCCCCSQNVEESHSACS
ncbi:unnamed protein product [Mytilus edulis]|uniref:Uncharacterized protein n=1 Tax=Mytilus edulis TaxID=6550 RepID=A0A8S3SGG8_MYTED|nr:unnamed protein product [Mytilus edulis]